MSVLSSRSLAVVLVTAVLMTSLSFVVTPTPARAAGTILFQNAFNDRTVDGTGTVTKPTPTSGTNAACLTATGNSATLPLLSCSSTGDSQGSGKLRLTDATGNQIGGIFGGASFPTSNGLDVTFNSYQWGGGAADGLAFLLAAVDPANPAAATTIGPGGGSLGYSPAGSVKGLPNAYLGVGLDVFGNFSGTGFQGTGCTNNPNIVSATPGAVVVRGPGNNNAGYCGLTTTYDGTAGSKLVLRASTRAAAVVPVQVLINPTGSSFTSDSGVSVAAGTYKVVVKPVGTASKTLSGTLPTVAAGVYPSSTWTSAAGIPKQLSFGFVGSTGSVTDAHEISDVKVLTFNPVPQLAVSTTSYAAATSAAGDPVSYTVSASVLTGADENSPISVTQTTPTGVVPVGAFGSGWVCAAPVGQSVTCTTSSSSTSNGTTLPVINVVAIATAAVTASTVQNASTSRASSTDGNPGTDTVTTAGTRPAAPTGLAVTPTAGPLAGGNTLTASGSSSAAPTAIEIGTTAEQQAGTPVTLLPCPGAAATGCFTISGSNVVISSMPARATSATVTITFVTLGVAADTTYLYAGPPAAPSAPTATAGITSATVSWAAPANNGATISGYTVTPYKVGVAQAPITVAASPLSRVVTGLTTGVSYTFTVAATNSYGTSSASALSNAVIPYALPAAPVISAVSAGTLSAVLSWTTPSNNGSAISGYVVTPYLAGVAQTAQTFTNAGTTQTITGLTAGSAYTFKVAAQNQAGTGPASAASTAVTPNQSPSLTFADPPAGEVGVAYSRQLVVTNGTSPFVWSLSSGALPAGLSLGASTGLLSGMPTAGGSFTFTVLVTDASGATASKAVTLEVAAAPVITSSPPAGEVTVPYSHQPTLVGGTGPFTWAVTAGTLPPGLTINASTGLISGTPTTAGSYARSITATDAFGQVATKTATIVIAAVPTLASTPPDAQVGFSYSFTFAATGGTGPFTYSVTAGTLPTNFTLSSAGVLSTGSVKTAGTYSFTVQVVDAYGLSALDSVSIFIAVAATSVVKTANVTSAAPGSVVQFTVTINNSSTTASYNPTVFDPLAGILDDAVYNGDVTVSGGTVTNNGSQFTWSVPLPPGATRTMTYSVTVSNPDTGNKVLTGTISTTFVASNCDPGSLDSRCSATVTVPGLTIVKTADVSTTTPGSVVRFTIVVTNSGPATYAGAALSDNLAGVLDDAAYNADGTATAGSVTYAGQTLSWTGNLAVGASATITYSVTVANPDTGNRTLSSTVVSASAGSPCPSGNPAAQCSVSVTVLVPALSITNTASLSIVTPGTVVNYTVTLSNTGQTAFSGSTVSVALAAALDDATYNGNAAASAGSVVYSAGPRTLVWTGNLAIGASVTITASVTVTDPDVGDRVLTTVASSSAAGSTCPVGSANSACTSTVDVKIPQLTLAKVADVSTTTPGSVVHYTLTATNTGQTTYTSAAFTDALAAVLDDAVYDNNVATTAGSASVVGSTLSWSGGLAIGATATITYSVTVRNPDNGNRTLTGALTSSTPGSTCPNGGSDPRCTSSVQVLIPGLTFTTVADASSTMPGSVVQYVVTVVNSGQTPYSALAVTLDLAGALDDADYNYDASISVGDLVPQPDGTVNWILPLAPGATATGRLSLTVKSPEPGDKSLVFVVVSNAAGSTCATGSVAAGCRSTVPVLLPGLTITKTANASTVNPGNSLSYTITVLNNGQTTYPAATFTDSLANVLTDATYGGGAVASTGTISYAAPTLSWSGALAPGASATITYNVTVRDPDPGDKRMSNTVVSTSAGSNCASGSVDTRCTAAVTILVPGLTIVATASSPTTTPGAVVGYTVAVANSGATTYASATAAISLAGVTDDATYNADAAATVGAVGFAGSTISWTGALAVGATATVTYSVTVHATDGGDNLVRAAVTSTSTGSNCPAVGSDPRCSATVPVARLVIVQGYPQPTTTPGALLRLTATFTNTGQVPYTGITITSPSAGTTDDAIPTGDQTATSGTLVLSSTAITWTGSIPVGATVTVTGTLTVENPDAGDKVITGTLVSTAPGNNCPVGGTDTRCTALVTVLVPGLTIALTSSATTTTPGGVVGYTLTMQNTGQTPYTGAVVTNALAGVLQNSTWNGDAAATAGTLAFSSPTLTWTGDLAPGSTAVVTYSVTVATTPTADHSLANSVSSMTVGSTCPPASGNASCRRNVDILTPGLTIIKTADMSSATLGTTVTYTVVTTNSGQTAQPAASFDDSLAGVLDDATYNAGSTTVTGSGTTTFAAGVLSWSGSLAVGASSTVTYTVTVKNPDNGDKTMPNTIVSTTTGNNCLTGTADARCTATVAVVNANTLTFTKTADVLTTVAGAVVAYTVTAQNSSASPIGSANFADPLADVVDDATYNANATLTGGGTVTYASQTLSWSGSIAAGETITLAYSVTVNAGITGNQLLNGRVSSTSVPGSDNCLAASTDLRCGVTVAVARLELQQVAAQSTTTPGSTVTLTETLRNTGQVAYNGISIASPRADTSDDTIPTGDQTATSGVLVRTTAALTWTGDIPIGGTVTVTRTLTVKNPDTGNQLITATLVSTVPGNNCASGSIDGRCTFAITVLTPQLTIAKTANTTFVTPGGTATYTITINNTGQTNYVGAEVTDSLVGVLDDATYNGNAVTTSGSLSFSDPTLTWTGDLLVGATATITYSVVANSPATADKTMINPVSSSTVGSTCLPASGTPACRATVAVLTPSLNLSTTTSATSAKPGDTVAYTVVARNAGQLPYAAAAFTVALADVIDDATYNGNVTATAGTPTISAGVLSWTGALAIGATATITYSMTVNSPAVGANYLLRQTIVSTSAGSTCAVASTDPRCASLVAVAGLRIISLADVATAKPTDVIHYTGTFTNIGQVPYVGASIDVNVFGSIDDATYNGDATASSGSVNIDLSGPSVVWTGDIAVGATITFTASVTVNNPDTGDKLITTVMSTNAVASNCPVGAPAAACLNSVTVLTPGLTLTSSADATTAVPGQIVHYTVTITNTGQTAYVGAVVRDSLGRSLSDVDDDATYQGDGSATSGVVSIELPDLVWTGNLAIGEAVDLTYSVRINDPDLGDKLMVTVVTSGELGSTCPTGGTDPACTTLVTVVVPALDIALVADRTTTTPGGVVAYTVTIRNLGQTDYLAASVNVALAGVLDDAAYNGGSADSGTLTYSAPVITWTGPLEMGATATFGYTVTVADPDLGDRSLTTSVASATQGGTCSVDGPCLNVVEVLVPGLAVTTTADAATAIPGEQVGFTIILTNTGQTAYNAITARAALANVVDDAVLASTITASSGVVTYTAPDLTWTGSIPVGVTVTIRYRVTVRTPDLGTTLMSTTVVAAVPGSTCPTGNANPACTAIVDVLIPGLAVSTFANTGSTTPGAVVGYTIVLTNTGQTVYHGAVVANSLAGLLADADYDDNAVAVGGGVLGWNGSTLTWTGDLLVGGTVSVTYSVTVHDPDTGDKLMTTSVISSAPGSTCPSGGNAPACFSSVDVLVPGLQITKTADTVTVVAGAPVHYTVTLLNTGQTDYQPAQFSDPLAGVLDDATYAGDANADTGSVSVTNDVLVWTGALAVGETAVVTYSVTTTFPAAGDHALDNVVTSTSAGATCATGAEAGCESSVAVLVPALAVVKTADTTLIVAGGTVHYTLTATNTGAADYPAAVLTDSLTGVLDDASYGADATASSGGLSFGGTTLGWSGALARGATVTITYSVTVPVATAGGDDILVNRVSSTTTGSTCPVDSVSPLCVTSTTVAPGTLTLTGLTSSFTMTGPPDSTVTSPDAVTMTVTTNSPGGYVLTVQAAAPVFTGATPSNLETIPVGQLLVRESGTTLFTPMSATTPIVVHQQGIASTVNGDAVGNDYQMQIPFVPSDTYSVGLDYIVSAQ